MAENDQKDKTVEKVTGEVENTDKKENNEDRYEKVCFICHRPESVTGKMIDLPNNICVCPDCMQKSFDAMNNMNFGGMDYSQFMNMGPMMGFGDMDAQIPKSQRVKKKKPEESPSCRGQALRLHIGGAVVMDSQFGARPEPVSEALFRKGLPGIVLQRGGLEVHPRRQLAYIAAAHRAQADSELLG